MLVPSQKSSELDSADDPSSVLRCISPIVRPDADGPACVACTLTLLLDDRDFGKLRDVAGSVAADGPALCVVSVASIAQA